MARRRLATAVAGVLFFAVSSVLVLGAIGWPGRDYRDGDFFQYYAGAAAVASGNSPYDARWWTQFSEQQGSTALHHPPQPPSGDATWTTPYPLYLFVAILPIQLMPLNVAAAFWLVAQVLCVAAGLVFLARQLLTYPRRDGLLLVAIALGSEPLWLLPGTGNITGFLFGAVAGAAGTLLRGRPAIAGGFLAVAAIKPQSLVVAAFALIVAARPRDRRRLLMGGALIGLPFVAVSFALQPGWIAGWLASVAALQGTQFSNATGWTIDRMIPGAPPVAAALSVVGAPAVLGWWWWRVRPTAGWAIAAAIPVSVFVAPHGWTYEQLYLLVSATLVIAGLSEAVPRRRAVALTALAMVLGPIPWALYVWDLSRNGEEPSAIVPLLAFGVTVLAHRLSSRSRRPPPPVAEVSQT